MAQKVLGLDIGSYSIKGVLMRSRFGGGYEYLDSFYERIGEDGEGRSESITESIRRIISENRLEGEIIIASMPAQMIISRFLTLPFSDKKKLDQVINYEIENYVPFSADDIVTDYQVLKKGKGGAELFATVTGITGKGIAGGKKGTTGQKCFGVIDIGHTKSILTLVDSGGRIAHSHTISFGGAEINSRISESLGISLEEANSLKLNLSSRTEEVERVISGAFDELSYRVKQSIISFEMEHKRAVHEIYLTGGTSEYEDAAKLLTAALKIKCHNLTFSNGIQKSAKGLLTGSFFIAYGLTLRQKSSAASSTINFMLDKTTSNKETKQIINSLVKVFAMALILMLFYGVDLTVKKRDRVKELNAYSKRITGSFKELFPKVNARGQELAIIKEKIDTARIKANRVGALLEKGTSSLDILNELSLKLSEAAKGEVVEVYECAYNGKRLNILGETGSYNLTDSIKKSLEGSDMFKEVKMEYAKFTANQKRVKFSMRINMKQKGGN